MNLAIFQPDIPQNTGSMIRICSCFNIDIDIIHPSSFPLDDKSLNRVSMDYKELVNIKQHDSWEDYKKNKTSRLILLSTKGKKSYLDFKFRVDDNLIVGRESAGVPDYVHETADEILKIPMNSKARSLNVAVSSAIVISEAARQIGLIDESK